MNAKRTYVLALAVAAFGLLLAGCGGSGSMSGSTQSTGLPTPAAAATTNTYTGSQGPGLWSLTLDDKVDTFSYQAASASSATTGTTSTDDGFLKLTSSGSSTAGYALEIPGRVAFLRPGGTSTALVAAVPSTSCLSIGGYLTFQFDSLTTIGDSNFGHLVASTSTDGSSYTFGDQIQYELNGIPSLINGGDSYPSTFAATCSVNNGVARITASTTTAIPVSPTILIGPSGFYVEDQSGIASLRSSADGATFSGVAQPTSALTTSDVAAKSYLGFSSATGQSTGASTETQLISFGPSSSSSTALVGGAFPNDDPTQTAATDTTILFGTENSTNPGYYPAAKVTKSDPSGNCSQNGSKGTAGYDANGNPTCTFAAVAMVGNPEGKYAILVTAHDYTQYGAPYYNLYLLQQSTTSSAAVAAVSASAIGDSQQTPEADVESSSSTRKSAIHAEDSSSGTAGYITSFAGYPGDSSYPHDTGIGLNISAASVSLGAQGIAFDSAGNFYAAVGSVIGGIYEGGSIPKILSSATSAPAVGDIYDVAGNLNTNDLGSGFGGPARSAEFVPNGMRFDASGNIYFTDSNGIIGRIDANSTYATIIAGSYTTSSYTGDNGPASSATLEHPTGLFIDSSENIYVADSGSNVVRVIYEGGTVPGTLQAAFSAHPTWSLHTGYIYTVAGGGNSTSNNIQALTAQLSSPSGVFVDGSENLYIADENQARVVKVDSSGNLITIAGQVGQQCTDTYSGTNVCGDGGPATQATLYNPTDVAVDDANNIFISDSYTSVIRKIDSSTGDINVIAGQENNYYSGTLNDGGPATNALLTLPSYLIFDAQGNLYFSDSGNGDIREVYGVATILASQTVSFDTIADTTWGSQPITLKASSPSGITPIFKVNSGQATVSGNTLTITGAGTVTVEADVAAGNGYKAASATQSFTVGQATLTVTAEDLSREYGQPNPDLTNDYSYSGFVYNYATSTEDTAATVITGAPSVTTTCPSTTPSGSSCPIVIATQSGFSVGANYAPKFVDGTLTVSGGEPQKITFTTPPPASVTYGVTPIVLQATADSGLPVTYTVSGPANFSGSSTITATGSVTLTITGVGSVKVTASQPGNSTYGAATPVPETITVSQAVLTVTANSFTRIQGIANPTLTYTMTGFVNSSDTQATATSGGPSLSTTATQSSPVASYPITVALNNLQAANYTFNLVSGTLTVIAPTPQSITFGALSNVTYGAGPITLTATASSGLPVAYTVSGPATLSGSTLTIIGAGTVSVTANQAGNTTVYGAATPVTQSFTVGQAVLTITATSLSQTFGTAIPSTLPYTISGFVNNDTTAVVSGTPTLTTTALNQSPAGTTYPILIYAGTLAASNYTFTFVDGTITITGTQSFTITASPTTLNIQQGHIGQVTIILTPSEGYQGTVTLSCGTLPANVTCTFSPASLTVNSPSPVYGTLTVSTDSKLPVTAANRNPLKPVSSIAMAAFPFLGVLSGCLIVLRRRRLQKAGYLWSLCILLVLMAGLAGLSACGGTSTVTSSLAQPGASTVTVTASGAGASSSNSGNMTTALNLTINITQ